MNVALFRCGIVVSYETIRCWAAKFGPDHARRFRRKPTSRNDIGQAALALARCQPGWLCFGRNRANPPQHQGGQTASHMFAAKAGHETQAHHHRQAQFLQRSENSHVPLRKRERIIQPFRSAGALQRFVSIVSAFGNLFVPPPPRTFSPRHPSSPAPGLRSVEIRNCCCLIAT
jgi:putative transposase